MKVVGYISDGLAKVRHGLMLEWKVLQIIPKIDGKHRCAPKGTWLSVGDIEISCIYFFYGKKVHISSVRDLMF